jgi:subtilase family serine protease
VVRLTVPHGLPAALLCAFAALAAPAAAQDAPVRMKGTLSRPLGEGRPVGPLDRGADVRFSFTFPVRNRPQLDALLASLYEPLDPLYHRFLKTGEFAQRFGPTQEDFEAVVAFAKRSGLRVTAQPANRMVLSVAGPPEAVENALDVKLQLFRSEKTGRVFHGPDREPSLPASIAARVAGIVDLDDAIEPMSNLARREASGSPSPNGIGTGPNGGLSPNNIVNAYGLTGVTEKGTGQSIALFELDGYLASDITFYEDTFALPHVPLQNVLLDGVSGTPTPPTVQNPYPGGPAEVTLDIELAIALAPSMTKLYVYEGSSFVNIFNQIASDNLAQQVSSSWYDGRDFDPSQATRDGENTAFQQMASQGQSLYIATGDYGDKVRIGTDGSGNPILAFGVQDPSAQPWCTGVAGTTLATNGAGGAWQSETAWSGSTGGISTVWLIPWYQSKIVPAGTNGSSTHRNLPDVALDSDPNTGYSIRYYGTWFGGFGGTSCAAPLWAAFTARVNQHRASAGMGRLGFLNPMVYYLGHTSSRYAAELHDITTGNNGTYPAGAGYDNVTGWGTFQGAALLADLDFQATAFHVDGTYGGALELGTPQYPFKTVAGALAVAPSNKLTLIYIKGTSYPEVLTIGKHVFFVKEGGGMLTIGN